MAGITNVAAWGKAMWPGVKKWYGMGYDEHPEQWVHLVEKNSDDRYMVEEVGTIGTGLAKLKTENEPYQYEGTEQGFVATYRHDVYGLGIVVTEEAIDDDQYGVVAQRRAKTLGFSMRQTKEHIVANVYNNAFDSNYTGADGKEMCSNAHVNKSGGTWSNYQNADISEAALEQAAIDIMKFTNDKGLNISVRPMSLHVAVDSVFDVHRILESKLRVGTADNDTNALRDFGVFPKGVYPNNYFTDTDSWFIRTDAPDGVKLFQRWPMRFDMDSSFDTGAIKFIARERYSVGHTDPRGIYGGEGA